MECIPNRFTKGMPSVKITYEDFGEIYGGCFISHPDHTRPDKSCEIHVNTYYGEEHAYGVLIHEYTHFIQFLRGEEIGYKIDISNFFEYDTYDRDIDTFFKLHKHEQEALFYEHRYSNTDITDYWINKCIKNNSMFSNV